MYRTEVCEDSLDPTWASIALPICPDKQRSGGKGSGEGILHLDTPIVLEVWTYSPLLTFGTKLAAHPTTVRNLIDDAESSGKLDASDVLHAAGLDRMQGDFSPEARRVARVWREHADAKSMPLGAEIPLAIIAQDSFAGGLDSFAKDFTGGIEKSISNIDALDVLDKETMQTRASQLDVLSVQAAAATHNAFSAGEFMTFCFVLDRSILSESCSQFGSLLLLNFTFDCTSNKRRTQRRISPSASATRWTTRRTRLASRRLRSTRAALGTSLEGFSQSNLTRARGMSFRMRGRDS